MGQEFGFSPGEAQHLEGEPEDVRFQTSGFREQKTATAARLRFLTPDT
jgi:hypothetical protein